MDLLQDQQQCEEMLPGSDFMVELDGNMNPQGVDGTIWSAVGSQSDATVPWESAITMDSYRKVTYKDRQEIGHGDYMHKTSFVDDARATVFEGGETRETSSYFWAC